HRRRRSQHDAGASRRATEACEYRKNFILPWLGKRLFCRVSSARWFRRQANKILIAQRGNEHSPDAGLLERAKNSFHFIYGEPGPRREMIDDRRHSVLEHFGTSQLGGRSYLLGRQMSEILCRRSVAAPDFHPHIIAKAFLEDLRQVRVGVH